RAAAYEGSFRAEPLDQPLCFKQPDGLPYGCPSDPAFGGQLVHRRDLLVHSPGSGLDPPAEQGRELNVSRDRAAAEVGLMIDKFVHIALIANRLSTSTISIMGSQSVLKQRNWLTGHRRSDIFAIITEPKLFLVAWPRRALRRHCRAREVAKRIQAACPPGPAACAHSNAPRGPGRSPGSAPGSSWQRQGRCRAPYLSPIGKFGLGECGKINGGAATPHVYDDA